MLKLILIASFGIQTLIVELGAGKDKVDIYQLDESTCMFTYYDKRPDDILIFYNPVNCWIVYNQYIYEK